MLWQSYDSVLNIIGKYNGMPAIILEKSGLGLSTIVLSIQYLSTIVLNLVLKYNHWILVLVRLKSHSHSLIKGLITSRSPNPWIQDLSPILIP